MQFAPDTAGGHTGQLPWSQKHGLGGRGGYAAFALTAALQNV